MLDWIVQNAIGHIPIWVWPMLAGIAIGVHFVVRLFSRITAVRPWSYIIIPLCIITYGGSIFMWGGSGVAAIWQAQIDAQQKKIDLAVAESRDANNKLTQVRKQKNRVIVQRQVVIHERIKTVEKQIDAECKVNPAAIQILNSAAENPEAKK
jgi:hypothetical protein